MADRRTQNMISTASNTRILMRIVIFNRFPLQEHQKGNLVKEGEDKGSFIVSSPFQQSSTGATGVSTLRCHLLAVVPTPSRFHFPFIKPFPLQHSLHLDSMEYPNEKNSWMSVPQFGDWDQKHQLPDYSLDFSKIREMRKQNKKDFTRASIGNEEELVPNNHQHQHQHEPIHVPTQHHIVHSPTTRRTIFSYFNCCIKA